MNQDQDIHQDETQEKIIKILQIENKIDKLENKLESNMNRLETKLDKILELLEKDCKKMTDHIDFIENVYDNVKSPFYYLIDKVNSLALLSNDRLLN